MRIYTSYFDNLNNLPESVVPIAICGRVPEGYTGLKYPRLAPKKAFFDEWEKSHDDGYYIMHFYSEVLSAISVNEAYVDFETMAGGKDVALICYEPEGFCHRHIVAEWLSQGLNMDVTEF